MPAIPPALLQFAASLGAVAALVWLVGRLGLGSPAPLDRERATAALRDLDPAFLPAETGIDEAGRGALALDSRGRVALVRGHGAHWVARWVARGWSAQACGEGGDAAITVHEPGSAPIALTLPNAARWAEDIGRAVWGENGDG